MDFSNLPLYTINESNKVGERIYKTEIADLYYIDTIVHSDERGFYREISVVTDLNKVIGQEFQIKQLNHANSKKNVVRGMHAEDWNKLVTVTHGVCLCVLADIRPDSKTFLKTQYFLLGFGLDKALPGSFFITRGIANSMCIIDESVDYFYAVDKLDRDRDKTGAIAISLFDPDLNIQWPINKDQMIISNRDQDSITLREKFPEKF